MLGFEVSPVVQYVIAFAIIAALLGLFAIVLRRIGGKRFTLPGQDRGRGRQPRLGIVDVYDLDRQRQLVLLRRDNVEHLVMLGGPNDLVVESNIVRVPVARATAGGEYSAERLVQGESAPEQGRTAYDPAIAASAGGAAVGMTARHAEPAQREPAMQQRPQPAPPIPLRQQSPQAPQPRLRPAPLRPETDAQPVPLKPAAMDPAPASPTAPVPTAPTPLSPVRESAPAPASPSNQEVKANEEVKADEEVKSNEEFKASEEFKATQEFEKAPARAPDPGNETRSAETAGRPERRPLESEVTLAPPPPPPPEPKRGLFGFGRAVEAPAPMPTFPSRPRATPLAADFSSQRTPPKFAPAGDSRFGSADAAKSPARGLEGETDSEAKPTAETLPAKSREPEAPGAARKSGRPLDDAILSDMAKELEAALKRPAGAGRSTSAQQSPDRRPADRPDVPQEVPSSAGPSSPSASAPATPPVPAPPAAAPAPPPVPADDWPSEPKLYRPEVTVAAAAGAALASSLASPAAIPDGPVSPVPPRPYGGSTANSSEDAASPVADGRAGEHVKEKAATPDEPAAAPGPTPAIIPDAGALTVEKAEDKSAISTDKVPDEPKAAPVLDVEARHAAKQPVEEPDTSEPDEPSATSREALQRPGYPERHAATITTEVAPETSADEMPPPGTSAPGTSAPETSSSEASAGETVSPATVSPAMVNDEEKAASEDKKEPSPTTIDPFSVDEIEAEFARLLGRSVEKDTKNL